MQQSQIKRVDDFWRQVGHLKKCDGSAKYPQLYIFVKCLLSLSHGNAVPERGFSVNKKILESHGTSIGEDTIVALRRGQFTFNL